MNTEADQPGSDEMALRIERATKVLVGKPLWRCLRAADMAMFDFGRRKKLSNFRGEWREVGDFALHVQCRWRLARRDRVIVGGSDLYFPAEYHEGGEIPPDFRWDKHPNRLDKLLAELFDGGTREFMVEKVQAGPAGSLHISLIEDFSLDLLPDDSLLDEHWRMFVPGLEESHLIVAGRGVDSD